MIDHRELAKAIVDELLDRLAPKAPPLAPKAVDEPRYLTISAYAKRVGWSRSTVQTWVRAGLPTVDGRGGARVDVRAADEWIKLGGIARSTGGRLDA